MEFRDLRQHALLIRDKYAAQNAELGYATWRAKDYYQGFVGDVGDLGKLIMARENLRAYEDQEEKLSHELADCLWSLIVIADELSIDLEEAFLNAKLSTLGKKKGSP